MTETSGNRLGDAVSPYLQQHRDNPVHWREWSDQVLEEAKALDRPILLSVGYAACHWCHVMAHESFENEEVAAVMNRLFVNVKVDREERPDIDHLYMTALHALGEQGGWPMTMFLTPDGKPFFGGTYYPREPRYGRPGFVQVMEAIAAAWRDRREEIMTSAGTISDRLGEFLSRSDKAGPLKVFDIAAAAERIGTMMDPVRGGMRGAPKFPNAPYMEILARSALEDGRAAHRDAFLRTIRSLSCGGIYDHLGGGLHRYSTDDRWLVPHFEKMLYDNAQFLRHLSWAFRMTGEPLFRTRIAETVGWLKREMRVEGGGLAASLDADSPDADGHPEEGAYYVWREDEIDSSLGASATAFKRVYDVTARGNWEGKAILHRLHPGAQSSDPDFAEERAALLTVREGRAAPGRDDKVLADWNGMAIRALTEVSRSTGNEEALELARDAFGFVMREMVVDGRLRHAARGGRTAGLALSSDYGALIQAAVALFAATLDGDYRDKAEWLAGELTLWHGDGEGGHFMTASDSSDVLIRLRGDQDDAVPSGTAFVIEGLSMLAQATGSIAITEHAETAAALAAGRTGGEATGSPGILAATGRLRRGSELGLFGSADDAAFSEMLAAAHSQLDLDRLDLVAASVDLLPHDLPLASVHPTRLPAAFVCESRVCRAPVYEPAALAALLDRGP
ncbi:thioredoxin domain-containing protein [Aurantimonas sp. VKM B-3413]|uniref:thioredoxin domain-containing protein n=1 Tax=Aurantimonas sp. VKM B-3413 TaxID=2779401 RepID=UPI001E5C9B79|nr:thioredoxin domain-containing protein [Aurantimonas sp. VKM B-3413]MCB8840563.1 thioredoxin domain-containing protein [Aurantimonas sp. VKM B-3413]